MTEQTSSSAQAGAGILAGLSNELAEAVARAGQHVVRVDARRRVPASGIIWAADGVIVTADHVVETDEGIKVGLPDGREVGARLVGRDPGTDLAVLRAEATELSPATFVELAEVRVGGLALAIGRPGAGGPMATLGVVSALAGPWRTWRGGLIESLIQTDVTLYPGFSGGALVDATGRVAGLNTSILARGASVAVPAETIRRVVQALLTQGRVRRGYLGVSTQPVAIPTAIAQRLGLSQGSGLLLVGVEPNGPADQGGLLLGDVLVALADQVVRDADDLQALLGSDRVGHATKVRIIRGGESRELTVTIGERQ